MREDNILLEQEEIPSGEEMQTEETSAVCEPSTEETLAEDLSPEAVPVPEESSEEAYVPEESPEESGEALEETAPTEVPYRDRYYLRYREGKRTVAQDLEGTRAFLQGIGFDGGELRQAREGKNRARSFQDADKSKNAQIYCSYCGNEISGVEFYRSSGGRIRCTTCSKTVVNTKAEVEALCQRVISNMANFFGAHINVPISIEIMNERKLKKKIGVPLGTQDSQSVLILGAAVNKKDKYNIILENGAPRISLIATFAHELTHIWQYTNWDNKENFRKCAPGHRLLIYEGMAKWAEIQYLYLIGETNVARREEYLTRNREDAYGLGFCLYEERYPLTREAMTCDETPFTPDHYPFE